jgi:NAD(P)-dependent dehydrogenase (short-subunit alcohol dehydrogenase family)
VIWTISHRNVVVTGGTSGIGRATAEALAARGAHVTITSRDPRRGATAACEISTLTGTIVDHVVLDLTDRESIRRAATSILDENDTLAVLVNNAGAVMGRRRLTEEGMERTLATNHVGPFLLTDLLLERLLASIPARVINVASAAHHWAVSGFRFDDPNFERGYRFREAYGQSKLANILHARALADRYGERGLTAISVHPGMVRTAIGSRGDARLAAIAYRLAGWRMLSPAAGADTVVWAATAAEPPSPNGSYFALRSEAHMSRWATDPDAPDQLWRLTMELVGAEDRRWR